jgi:putative membrane protein
LLVREILLRYKLVSGPLVAAAGAICAALAISATYELVEWVSALALGQGADDFLGTQGDPWDTQSDMFMALIGAVIAMVLLPRWHDRQLRELPALEIRSS